MDHSIVGVSTFMNIGNTCYFNAMLQSLMATDSLVIYLIDDKYQDDIVDKTNIKKSMIYYLSRIIKAYWNSHCVIKPHTLKLLVSHANNIFVGCSQNDSHEALHCILEHIHEETKRNVTLNFKILTSDIQQFSEKLELITNSTEKITFCNANFNYFVVMKSIEFYTQYIKNNYSCFFDMFTGTYINMFQCCKCHNNTVMFEPFNTLSLPIENAKSLIDCFVNFTTRKQLIGDEQYFCNICNTKTDGFIDTKFWHIPSKLIIHLKRFSNNMTKNNSDITFPIERLDITPYFMNQSKPRIYNLYAIIIHYGSVSGGHYVAITKNLIDRCWYLYNDSTAYKIIDINKEIDTQNSYILFYERSFE